MKKTLLFITITFYTLSLFSQITNTDIKFNTNYYQKHKVAPLDNETLLHLSETSQIESGLKNWNIVIYDSKFDKINSSQLRIEDNQRPNLIKQQDSIAYLFFNSNKHYTLCKFNLNTFETSTSTGSLRSKMSIEESFIWANKLYLYCENRSGKYFLTIDLRNNEKKSINFNVDSYKFSEFNLIGYQIDEEDKLLYIFANNPKWRKSTDTFQFTFDLSGELINYENLTKNIDINLVDISLCKSNNHEFIYSGLYSEKFTEKSSKGFYFFKRKNGKISDYKEYTFAELDTVETFLNEKDLKSLNKGNKDLKSNYSFITHKTIAIDDNYYLISERYRKIMGTTYRNGKYVETFLGYENPYAFIVKFNNNGEILWNHCFKTLKWNKEAKIKRIIRTKIMDDVIHLSYIGYPGYAEHRFECESGKRKTLLVSPNQPVLENLVNVTLNNIHFTHWYKEYYIVAGRKSKKNIIEKEYFFFIKKLTITEKHEATLKKD